MLFIIDVSLSATRRRKPQTRAKILCDNSYVLIHEYRVLFRAYAGGTVVLSTHKHLAPKLGVG
jgi:hypothetical protein